jgi:hypothetical protein
MSIADVWRSIVSTGGKDVWMIAYLLSIVYTHAAIASGVIVRRLPGHQESWIPRRVRIRLKVHVTPEKKLTSVRLYRALYVES